MTSTTYIKKNSLSIYFSYKKTFILEKSHKPLPKTLLTSRNSIITMKHKPLKIQLEKHRVHSASTQHR